MRLSESVNCSVNVVVYAGAPYSRRGRVCNSCCIRQGVTAVAALENGMSVFWGNCNSYWGWYDRLF